MPSKSSLSVAENKRFCRFLGKSLKEIGICDSDTLIIGVDKISEAVKDADVYVTFTTPFAEVANLPLVARLGKRIVLGTTGFT